MEKRIKSPSLFIWMIILFTFCIVVSFSLSMIASNIIETAQSTLVEFREISPDSNEMKGGNDDIRIINKESGKSYMEDIIEDKGLYYFYEVMQVATPILIFSISLFLSAWVFYKYKLKTPIHALQVGISQIERQDLDFKITYKSEDELGLLCRAFDTMRERLKDSFLSLWAEKEKQILLTRALAHDLRTPLTVIKGHTDLITLSLKNKVIEPARVQDAIIIIGEHISRLEKYLNNTRDMQALEEWQLYPEPVSGETIAGKIQGMNTLNDQISLYVKNKMNTELSLDEALVMRVLENLISNAFEYAKYIVTITIDSMDGYCTLIVENDGNEFSPEDLRHAAAAFYRGDKARSSGHMGLGLTIAKTLAERHGGKLTWGNNNVGVYVKATFKSL